MLMEYDPLATPEIVAPHPVIEHVKLQVVADPIDSSIE